MMDHRWDESTLKDRETRAEEARFGTSRIEHDRDVERRDQLCLADRIRMVNRSPWEIGTAWYDQRDTYTRNSEIDASGYGCGPNLHPEEGSYAYPRRFHLSENEVRASHASHYEKEAWPWLIYKEPQDDPYFSHLAHEDSRTEHHESVWERLRTFFVETFHLGERTPEQVRADERITADVSDALTFRSHLDASDILVSCARSEVTLDGTVPDHESKERAEEAARAVRGVHGVKNHLKVRRGDGGGIDAAFVMSLAF
jgi:hypothetical protein